MKIDVKLVNKNISKFDDLLLHFGLCEKEITIIDGFLEIPNRGLVYIFGNSGSGKSYTLKQIANKLNVPIKKVNIAKYDDIDAILKDYIQDLRLLAQFGFSDIPVLLTPVRYLSDGQKYRLFLLEELQKNDVLVFDEFCNPLDEFYSLSILKTLMKFKDSKLIITATSRPIEYRYFDIDFVYKIQHSQIYRIVYQKKSLYDDLKIEKASKKDWEYFSRFHYRNKSAGLFNRALKAVYKNEPVGMVIGGQPYLNISIRNKIFPQYKNNGKLVNRDIFCVHRIVIAPEMRNLGISRVLLFSLENWYKEDKKILSELMSALSSIIPFAEKAGYKYGGQLPDNPIRKLCKKLKFDFNKYLDIEYVRQFVLDNYDAVYKAVKASKHRGIDIKFTPSLDVIVRDVQLMANVVSRYYYKIL